MAINIYLRYGKDVWAESEYTDYMFHDDLFVVKRGTDWVGIYPIRNVYKIVVK